MISKWIVVALFFLGFSNPVFAYSDRVDAPAREIYDAALKCFAQEGIDRANPEELSLTTKWVSKTVRRFRHRRFVPIRLKETVDIRYKMQVKIEEGQAYSEVLVRGIFEEKPTDGNPMQPWKSSPSSKELYFKEREAFFRLLNFLEEQKKSSQSPASAPIGS